MWRSVAGFCLCVWLSPAVRAESMRCADNLIDLGDTEAAVRDKCGEPTTRRRRTATGRRGKAGKVTVIKVWDEWIYDWGPTTFVRILTFDVATDRLTKVELGDYGH